jgi:hypothetical protein
MNHCLDFVVLLTLKSQASRCQWYAESESVVLSKLLSDTVVSMILLSQTSRCPRHTEPDCGVDDTVESGLEVSMTRWVWLCGPWHCWVRLRGDDTAESDFVMMTLLSQTSWWWHCRVRLCDDDTAESDFVMMTLLSQIPRFQSPADYDYVELTAKSTGLSQEV